MSRTRWIRDQRAAARAAPRFIRYPQDSPHVRALRHSLSFLVCLAVLNGVGVLSAGRVAWNIRASGQPVVEVVNTLHAGGQIRSLAFSGDGRFLVSGSVSLNSSPATERLLKLWDVRKGRLVRTFAESGSIEGADISRDGKLVASVQFQSAVKLWDTGTGRLIRSMAVEKGSGVCCVVAISPDGTLVVSKDFGPDSRVLVWSIRTGALVRKLGSTPYAAETLAFSSDGRTLAVAAVPVPEYRPVVDVWDVRTGRLTRRLLGNHVVSLAYSGDGETLATVEAERAGHMLVLWDVRTAKQLPSPLTASPDYLGGWPYRVAYWSSGPVLAMTWEEMNGPHVVIRLWDLRRQTTVYTLRSFGGPTPFSPDVLAFSPDGTLLAASFLSDIVVWDVRDILKR